jgi:hypothetical protein
LLYHSTRKEYDPTTIKPGTHFGNLRAATERGWTESGNRIHSFKHKPTGKTVWVRDKWADNPPEPYIADQLTKKGILSKKERDITVGMSNRDWFGDNRRFPPPTKRTATGPKVLGRYLKRKGISTVKYRNSEEDKGSVSTIEYDPKSLQHHYTFKFPQILRRHKAKLNHRYDTFAKFRKRKAT